MNNKQIVIWGLARGETESYKEQVLSSRCLNASDVAKVYAAATKDGWHSLRTAVLDMSKPPDFTATISKKVKR